MRAPFLLLCATAFAVSLSWAGAAHAEDAQQLFKEGLGEMMDGNYESGCPKIERAYELSKGAGGLFTAAECYAKWGRPKTALRHYRAYLGVFAALDPAERAAQQERSELASSQVKALTPLVPTWEIVVPEALAGATVTIDGESSAADGPVKLEVGKHRAMVTTADGRTAEREIELAAGAHERWSVKLGDAPNPDPDPDPDESSEWTTLQITGFVVGGMGVAMAVVGVITGAMAVDRSGTVDEHCDGIDCDAVGLDAAESGKTLGDVATATLVIGGAAVAAGIILIIIGGDDAAEVGLHISDGGLSWRW